MGCSSTFVSVYFHFAGVTGKSMSPFWIKKFRKDVRSMNPVMICTLCIQQTLASDGGGIEEVQVLIAEVTADFCRIGIVE